MGLPFGYRSSLLQRAGSRLCVLVIITLDVMAVDRTPDSTSPSTYTNQKKKKGAKKSEIVGYDEKLVLVGNQVRYPCNPSRGMKDRK